jgi:hypothetical protein
LLHEKFHDTNKPRNLCQVAVAEQSSDWTKQATQKKSTWRSPSLPALDVLSPIQSRPVKSGLPLTSRAPFRQIRQTGWREVSRINICGREIVANAHCDNGGHRGQVTLWLGMPDIKGCGRWGTPDKGHIEWRFDLVLGNIDVDVMGHHAGRTDMQGATVMHAPWWRSTGCLYACIGRYALARGALSNACTPSPTGQDWLPVEIQIALPMIPVGNRQHKNDQLLLLDASASAILIGQCGLNRL